MIQITRKEDCIGCRGCVQTCPKQCISFNEDIQGFCYPKVDLGKCIHCNLCEKVCPVINQNTSKEPITVYAAENNNRDIKAHSSSGGIFYALAEEIIAQRGVVFGARFNDKWEVEHGYSEDIEGVKAFQTSKYVQSHIGNSFCEVKTFLDSGRKVMFTGTPCQIAGLKLFLREDYPEQLFTVDIVCHGVPSPGIWREYLNYVKTEYKKNIINPKFPKVNFPIITSINFRDKRLGWNKYGVSICVADDNLNQNSVNSEIKSVENNEEILFEPFSQNLYMQGFLKNFYLRPSCYQCPTKQLKSHSDITLADFWGVQRSYPDFYKATGVSLVLINTSLGEQILKKCSCEKNKVDYSIVKKSNPAINKSSDKPDLYDYFWENYFSNGLQCLPSILEMIRPNILEKIIIMIKRFIIKSFNL